ncbi:hypothetical protein [Kineococcus terrestris]|uniref:hypothetical protein n=1 Tax=Kineococcus terrestris TaxID=2044856 RepID=UPI0034DB6821
MSDHLGPAAPAEGRPAAAAPRRSRADGRRPLVLLLLGQAVTGLLLGVGWWALARTPPEWLVGEPVVATPAALQVARDGSFAVLTGLVGVLVGVLVLRMARPAPLATLLTAVAGALAGALLAAGTGSALPPADPADPAHVGLLAWGVVLVQPFAAAAVVALVTLASAVGDWVRRPEG